MPPPVALSEPAEPAESVESVVSLLGVHATAARASAQADRLRKARCMMLEDLSRGGMTGVGAASVAQITGVSQKCVTRG